MSFLLLLAAYTMLLMAISCKEYRKILILNVGSCFLAAVYLYLNGALVGATISSLAGLASFSQLCLPSEGRKPIKVIRNSVALLFSVIATAILYSKPSDMLPCIAFCNNRIMEAQAKGQLVRLGLVLGGFLWAIYGLCNGLYLYTFAEMLVCVTGLKLYLRTKRRLSGQLASQ